MYRDGFARLARWVHLALHSREERRGGVFSSPACKNSRQSEEMGGSKRIPECICSGDFAASVSVQSVCTCRGSFSGSSQDLRAGPVVRSRAALFCGGHSRSALWRRNSAVYADARSGIRDGQPGSSFVDLPAEQVFCAQAYQLRMDGNQPTNHGLGFDANRNDSRFTLRSLVKSTRTKMSSGLVSPEGKRASCTSKR